MMRGAAVVAGVVVAGCASATQPSGSAMMGGGSGYHFSPATCSAPSSLPGATVRVTLADMGMTQMMGGTAALGSRMMLLADPSTGRGGQVSFLVSNQGWRIHELVILPLAVGAAAGQRVPGADGKIDESGSRGESSSSCAGGAGAGIAGGALGWTTVTLAPGRYELVCNLPNHYADGMYQELVLN